MCIEPLVVYCDVQHQYFRNIWMDGIVGKWYGTTPKLEENSNLIMMIESVICLTELCVSGQLSQPTFLTHENFVLVMCSKSIDLTALKQEHYKAMRELQEAQTISLSKMTDIVTEMERRALILKY